MWRTGAVLLSGALAAGCTRAAGTVRYDLARDAELAELRLPESIDVRLAPPVVVRAGLKLLRQRGGDEDVAAARHERTAFVSWRGLAPREAVLDLEAPAGGEAVVFLNETELARLALEAGRKRHRLSLPREAQARRHNRIRVVMPERARLRSVGVGSARLPDATGSRDEPPLLDPLAESSLPTLEQTGPSALRFAIRLPDAAELRFTPMALGDAGGAARMRVSFEPADGPERDLWSGDPAQPGGTNEVAIPLPDGAGSLARLSLNVDSQGRAAWRAPRLLGRGDGRSASSSTAGEQPRAEALKRALRGVSVLLVVLDAASARHFGCYGYERTTTPEIDRLAAEGVLFEQAYTPAVYTLSAIASLWTSLHHEQHHAGVRHSEPLPAGPLTVPELLRVRGVHTAGFVANPSAGRPFGLDRGFAEFHEPYRKGGRFVGVPRAESFRPLLERFLAERRGGGPFFAYVHFIEPHFPYDPQPPFDTLFGPDAPLPESARRSQDWIRAVNAGASSTPAQRDHLVRLYDGNLAAVDRELGRVRAMLEASGMLERTVLIVSADHGESLGEHGFIGHAPQVYEEAVHVPLVVRFPKGVAAAGTRLNGFVDLLDLAPTLLDLFGVAWPEGVPPLEGRSLLPMLAGAPGKPFVVSRSMAERPVFGLREGRHKFVHSLRDGRSELFDLASDPGEQSDLADAEPLRVEFHRQALYRWLEGLGRTLTAPSATPVPLSEEDRAALRALGYVE